MLGFDVCEKINQQKVKNVLEMFSIYTSWYTCRRRSDNSAASMVMLVHGSNASMYTLPDFSDSCSAMAKVDSLMSAKTSESV
jgi:hypothetical protein